VTVRLVGRRRLPSHQRQSIEGGVDLSDGEEEFWQAAAEFLSLDGVEKGAMFRFPCIRLRGSFVAMPGNSFGGMVVKLPAVRAAELIESGQGKPVAPAGRPFREWVAIDDKTLWHGLIDESLSFAGHAGHG